MNYILMTDSDSDMPFALKAQYDIPVVHMPYTLDGVEYYDDLGQTLDSKTYFDKMRAGAAPVTAALNEQNYIDYFEPYLKADKDILFVAFSSQLSRTILSAQQAAETLKETYPERRIVIVDTLSISGPQALLVLKAHEMYRDGKSLDEVAAWLESNKLRAQAFFTVDDLVYLKRGGRISATAAMMGSLLDLKPVLVENREGKLVAIEKIRGRKKALNFLVDKTVENTQDVAESPYFVLHADDMADAEKLANALKERLPEADIRIENIGPVIGAHAGPGALAICFIGKERTV
ncbi:MAG: DegV family protein [Clostridia bacterium]|nr:DegV family protein [Clostridia bacterium]